MLKAAAAHSTRRSAAGALFFVILLLAGGCSWFARTPRESARDPFADGTLKAIGAMAPANSPAQFLARIADGFGWESQVGRNDLLRRAIQARQFDDVAMPFLLGLFYRNGFSVLPRVGEGNQFARDTIVRGVSGTSRLLVTSREPLKLIFLGEVDNIQIVYPQDGQPPQIFTVSGTGIVAVRRSELEQYLQ